MVRAGPRRSDAHRVRWHTGSAAPTGRIDVHQHMIPDDLPPLVGHARRPRRGGVAVPEWSASPQWHRWTRPGRRGRCCPSRLRHHPGGERAEAQDIARTVNDAAPAGQGAARRFASSPRSAAALDAGAREATRALDELGADGRGEGESFPCNRALPAAIGVHDEPQALRLPGPAQQRRRLRGC